jgi:hypothetical protein
MRSYCAARVASPFAIACRLVADLPSADDDEEEISAFDWLDSVDGERVTGPHLRSYT